MKPSNKIESGWASKTYGQNILRIYSMRQVDFDKLWAEQGGKCPICKEALAHPTEKKLGQRGLKCEIDHRHVEGESKNKLNKQCELERVRGILCVDCNALLGVIRESITFAEGTLAYLKKYGVSDFDADEAPRGKPADRKFYEVEVKELDGSMRKMIVYYD